MNEVFGEFRLRAIGGSTLQGSKLFRSRELSRITSEEALFLANTLEIAAIYDIRTQWEVAACPEPCLIGVKTVALEPSTERRRKDASKRLVTGVIQEYGAPESRMQDNYRRYAKEYPLIGKALRSIAAEAKSALVHCVNGKDRTGVLCATLLKIAGIHPDEIMEDYLIANEANAEFIEKEVVLLSEGMTDYEYAILLSFLEARPSYLEAFFNEIEKEFGSFKAYVENGLRLTPLQTEILKVLVTA